MTDAVRANVLEYCGYNTQLLEFIDIAHSPKNILIRAVNRNKHRVVEYPDKTESKELMNATKVKMDFWNEAERLCTEFHFKQTLMELVREGN